PPSPTLPLPGGRDTRLKAVEDRAALGDETMAEPVKKPEQPAPDPAPEHELRLLGTPFRRVDGRAKVTGATRFADDLAFPRMAYLKLVRSTVPHARIAGIDCHAAAAVPGVLGFLTGADFPVPFGILPVSQDEHALCPDKVRFV